MTSADPTYSIVVPIYNEAGCIAELSERLCWLMDQLDGPTEVVLVDDGSTDNSYAQMAELARRDPRFKAVGLSRNFGHQVALTAGFDLAAGAAVVTMDADLQHPPETILEMAKLWRDGYQVVYGVMRSRITENRFKRFTSDTFYSLLRRLVDVHMPANAGDFRMVDRAVVDVIRSMPERNRYLRGMFAWVGFRQIGVDYDCAPRHAGKSSYNVTKMLRLALNAVVGFSVLPLRLALGVGVGAAFISMAVGIAAIVAKVAGWFTVPGWTTVVVVVTFLGGVQLVVLGLMGEYVGRIYDEVKQRPLYLVGDAVGVLEWREPDSLTVVHEATDESPAPEDVRRSGASRAADPSR
ncbi:MAG: glycosyltransferase family 2 protein [Mycobacteriales bacterium]